MRAKDVVAKAKEIKEEKQRKLTAKEEAKKKKEETTGKFINIKSDCTCKQIKCQALGLK